MEQSLLWTNSQLTHRTDQQVEGDTDVEEQILSHVDTRGQTHEGAQALSAGSKLRKLALRAESKRRTLKTNKTKLCSVQATSKLFTL